MGKRPTLKDVAAAAGVSVATVDRALNGRETVRPEALRRIAAAAQAVGYHGAPLAEERLRADQPVCRFGFLLLDEAHQPFFRGLGTGLEREVAGLAGVRGRSRVDFIGWRDPIAIARRLREFGRQVDALAAVTIDHPAISAAVADLKGDGVPVFSLLSDFAPGIREAYVGLNNRKAGRAAAWMIARAAPQVGKVAIIVGSSRFHGHEMREIGFRSYFREKAPGFEVVDTLVNPGAESLARRATLELLARHPDLAGLYVGGLGPEGIIEALRDSGVAGQVIAIANELTPESAEALGDETLTAVVETPMSGFCRETVGQMLRAILDGPAPMAGQAFLPFNLVIPESI